MSTTPTVRKFKRYVAPSPDTASYIPVASALTDGEVLDGLFEDDTTVGLGLPPIVSILPTASVTAFDQVAQPKSSPAGSSDHSHDPGTPQKRKRENSASDGNLDDDLLDSPRYKKGKQDEEVEKENERKGKEAARHQYMAAIAASMRPSVNTSKLFKSMKKQAHIPKPKYVPTGNERRKEVKLLAKEHVRHVAPTMLANIKTNRDVEGKKNKFDLAESRREIPKNLIKAPEYKAKKWVDENDDNVTWLEVPVSMKTINTNSSMVSVDDIVNHPYKNPEFTLVKTIFGPHAKTGEEVVKAYTIKHEKLEVEQSLLRSTTMIKQQKAEARQAKKDEAARRRIAKPAGLSEEARKNRVAVKEGREQRARAREEKSGVFE
jgi:cyclophilin family peptidyl-prolyl cis-trans isomerase